MRPFDPAGAPAPPERSADALIRIMEYSRGRGHGGEY